MADQKEGQKFIKITLKGAEIRVSELIIEE